MVRTGNVDFSCKRLTSNEIQKSKYHIIRRVRFRKISGSALAYPCFSGVLFTSTSHNILFKLLAAFPYNHCGNNGLYRQISIRQVVSEGYC